MGNCPACSSIFSEHGRCSSGDHTHEDGALVNTTAASTACKDCICKPLLKPCIIYSNKHIKGKLHLLRNRPAPAALRQTTGDTLKVNKKMRFADKIIPISSSRYPSSHETANEEGESPEMLDENIIKPRSGVCIDPTTISIHQSSNVSVKQSGKIVRMKVVISKKQLRELLADREKHTTDGALMATILSGGSLLPSKLRAHHKISPCQCSTLLWQPSLEAFLGAHI